MNRKLALFCGIWAVSVALVLNIACAHAPPSLAPLEVTIAKSASCDEVADVAADLLMAARDAGALDPWFRGAVLAACEARRAQIQEKGK